MRIVLLYLGRKGAGPIYSLEYAKALLNKGINVYAIVSSYSENIDSWRDLLAKYDKQLFKLKEVPTYKSAKDFLFKSLNICLYYDLVRTIKEDSPDIVVSTMIHPWHNIIFLCLKGRVKRIKVIHDVKPHTGEDSLIYRVLNYFDIHITDFRIVLTQKAKKELIDFGVDQSSIAIIPHAQLNGYAKAKIEFLDVIQYKIAFIGRINRYKGLDILLQAFKNIRGKIPQLKLLIAGSGDCSRYLPAFKEMEDSLDLNIRWIADDEFPSIIEKVDLVVLPYIEATQSGIIPLSFAFGKTVIATYVGGLPEQVPQGTGLLIPPKDPVALENAIQYLYDNPRQILEMGKKAFIYANEELGWEKSADLFVDFCKMHLK